MRTPQTVPKPVKDNFTYKIIYLFCCLESNSNGVQIVSSRCSVETKLKKKSKDFYLRPRSTGCSQDEKFN